MKKTLLLLSVMFVVFSCKKEATQEDVVAYGETITADELKDHLYIYASDEFEGRDTGAPGQKKAVEYLKKEYETMGIPSVIEGNYFQTVPLNIVIIYPMQGKNSLCILHILKDQTKIAKCLDFTWKPFT